MANNLEAAPMNYEIDGALPTFEEEKNGDNSAVQEAETFVRELAETWAASAGKIVLDEMKKPGNTNTLYSDLIIQGLASSAQREERHAAAQEQVTAPKRELYTPLDSTAPVIKGMYER